MKKKKKYHETNYWTATDDFIEGVAEWMNNNIGLGDFVEIRIDVKDKGNVVTFLHSGKIT